MLSPSDFEVPENEIADREDELVAEYRPKATVEWLGQAITDSVGETRAAIQRALDDSDSMMLGQAGIAALFDWLRNDKVQPALSDFIMDRKEQLCEEHEERIHRRASNE